jgi:hypothetical protein
MADAIISPRRTVDASRFKKVPLAEITSPEKPGPLWPYKDYWWKVTEDDCVLIYTHRGANSPQCNTNRAIVERVLCPEIPTRAVFLPWAYLQFGISEYA